LALANELAIFCEKASIDYLETQKLMEHDNQCTLPMPTLADGSIQKGPYLLLDDAENLNMKLQIPAIAAEVNEEVIKHAATLTREALRDCGKTLRRARIVLLGLSQTPNMKSHAKKTVREFVKMLEAKGVRISLYDPYFSTDELAEMQIHGSKNLAESIENVDCVILATGHEPFKRLDLRKVKVVVKMPAAIVDLEGIVNPANVEKEGFIYRGLGRGVWKK
jgi:UDP-N-acetyl-D-mannosaminuronate dehydrogenase